MLCAIAASIAISACGGDDDDGGGATATGGNASSVGDTLSLGTDPTYPPLEYKKGADLTGAEVEIMEAVAEELGAKATWMPGDFATMIPSLKAKRFDAIAAGLLDQPGRRKSVLFVDYLGAPGVGGLFPIDKAPPNADPEHLCDLTVAAGKGTSVADGKDPALPKLTEDVCPKPVKVLILPNEPAAQLAVQSGRADVFMTSYMSVGSIAKTAGGGDTFKAIEYPGVSDEVIAVGVRAGDTKLANELKDAIQKVMDSGKYEEILSSYGIEGMALEAPTLNGKP